MSFASCYHFYSVNFISWPRVAPLFAVNEASLMDPQQRVLLEETVAAFRQAGHSADQLLGSPTGVFVGCIWLEYGEQLAAAGTQAGAYMVTGERASLADRAAQGMQYRCWGCRTLSHLLTQPRCSQRGAFCRSPTLNFTVPCRQRPGFHGRPGVLHPGPGGPLRAHQHRLLVFAGGIPPGGPRDCAGKPAPCMAWPEACLHSVCFFSPHACDF